ncbi:MAG: PEP-CTERM sorting domain-containing protein [Planctomycetota bacterium]
MTIYSLSDVENYDDKWHAIILPPADSGAPGLHYTWIDGSDPTLTFDGTSWEDSTTAVMRGQVIQAYPGPDTPTAYDLELHFHNGQSFDDWLSTPGHDFKNEADTSEANYTAWRMFTLNEAETNQLTRLSGPGVEVISIELKMADVLAFQVGIGADMKDPDTLGASAWVLHQDAQYSGDINVGLTLVPEPTSLAYGLAVLGALGLRRRRSGRGI